MRVRGAVMVGLQVAAGVAHAGEALHVDAGEHPQPVLRFLPAMARGDQQIELVQTLERTLPDGRSYRHELVRTDHLSSEGRSTRVYTLAQGEAAVRTWVEGQPTDPDPRVQAAAAARTVTWTVPLRDPAAGSGAPGVRAGRYPLTEADLLGLDQGGLRPLIDLSGAFRMLSGAWLGDQVGAGMPSRGVPLHPALAGESAPAHLTLGEAWVACPGAPEVVRCVTVDVQLPYAFEGLDPRAAVQAAYLGPADAGPRPARFGRELVLVLRGRAWVDVALQRMVRWEGETVLATRAAEGDGATDEVWWREGVEATYRPGG
ncbi:MAG: hypothetical protein H6732_05880 [Alphaproteobacteria bacterium]|nr:hypothetical protein [Alphaproteobacteria bacterium]